MHIEDPGALALFPYRARIVRQWQAHLVRVYMRFRTLPKFRGCVAPGLHTRVRPKGPPPFHGAPALTFGSRPNMS